jgi:phosphopantetheinyl transferase
VFRFKRPIGSGSYLTGKDNPDAKSSLIGRLMQRKMVHDFQDIPYSNIQLLRTKKGKPYFVCDSKK